LHNSNKQRLIITKFYFNYAPIIDNQNAKFELNLRKQTIVTAALVWSLQNTSVSSVCE